ncbi:MAG: DUF1559 domain-containing protein [Armatimonadetes bacterium]|nr:DUF1559 domain-containing protein [Armatimonadota bacterium]
MRTQRGINAGEALAWILAALVFGAIAVAVLFPVFARRPEGQRPSCQGNLKQIGTGFKMYEQDYGAWPPEPGWVTTLQPYMKSPHLFVCPSEPKLSPGYAMNPAMGGQSMKHLPEPDGTVLSYDARNGKLCFRHSGGCNNLFGDGHVKWLRPNAAEALLKEGRR